MFMSIEAVELDNAPAHEYTLNGNNVYKHCNQRKTLLSMRLDIKRIVVEKTDTIFSRSPRM